MKYADEYRDRGRCRKVARMIYDIAEKSSYKIMEVCGTHTEAIQKFGIRGMVPSTVELISGPGCPVCVTSEGYLKNAVALARDKDVMVATYPDMVRVPAGGTSLEKERACGADVRAVMSALDAVALAKSAPGRDVVFLGVGFETTAPGTALALMQAEREKVGNFFVYSGHKTIPEALDALGNRKDLAIQGFLLPGHVSAVIGVRGYARVLKKRRIPAVVSGFEALDILVSLYALVKAINGGFFILENEYSRIVRQDGNLRARTLLSKVFQKEDAVWRGLGVIPSSGLSLRKRFRAWDAAVRFSLAKDSRVDPNAGGCRCADVLTGKIKPSACPLFRKKCRPEAPLGACMVSREGTCRTYYDYR